MPPPPPSSYRGQKKNRVILLRTPLARECDFKKAFATTGNEKSIQQ